MTLLCLFVCALVAVAHAQNNLSVNTTQGVVIGEQANDGDYYNFLGVRYGGTTSGSNRFKAPPPPSAYPGTFYANTGTICAQPSIDGGIVGTEDCLTLNIFTNGLVTSKPVLVWLQSEEYTTSNTQQNSYRRLVSEGLVVVSMNYRLSIFGFLCLGVNEAPGNAGLKDVIQGLRWINENIAAFGGNPNNVAIFGVGSGAAIVDLVTMSPLSENLVHKAISQSGSALAPWSIAYEPVQSARSFGDKLGYDGKNNKDLATLLANTDITLFGSILEYGKFTNNTAQFAPCIEDNNLNSTDTFLSDTPLNIIRSGNYRHIPYIAGYTNREGTIRAGQAVNSQWLEKMQANFTDFLPVDIDFTRNQTLNTIIRRYYFGERNISLDIINDYLDYHGDTMILVSVIRGAWERALTSRADVRLYEFAYRGTKNSDWLFPQIPLDGAKHAAVLNYLLDIDLRPEDEPVMQSLVQRYRSFLYDGLPIINSTQDWPAITNNTLNYFYYIGGTNSPRAVFAEPRTSPHEQRMTLWNEIYSQYYKAPTPTSSADKILSLVFAVFLSQILIALF